MKLRAGGPDKEENQMNEANQMKTAAQPEKPTQNLESVVRAVGLFLDRQSELFDLVYEMKRLLPKKDVKEVWTMEQFTSFFIHGRDNMRYQPFKHGFGLSPSSIGLITIHNYFSDATRWKIYDPTTMPEHAKLSDPYKAPKVLHTTISIASDNYTIPVENELWVEDIKTHAKFVVNYELGPGSVKIEVQGQALDRSATVELSLELKKEVVSSKYLKGQIVEVSGGSDFKIVDIGTDHPLPIIDATLMENLETNVLNVFDKADEFKKQNLPLTRSVILEGDPGNGKTMISRYLASKLRGKVTTVWVTAKSIEDAEDVAEIFDIARRLSPSLVVMEDLDLIAGTRDSFRHGGSNPLGEMLNQLDGLEKHEAVVLIGSTNRAASLDDALRDRPGRFDRIFTVDKPNSALAKQIAQNYLRKRGVTEEHLGKLRLDSISSGEFTGAQIVEVVKGGFFEAIHKGVPINDMTIAASKKGLEEQRKLFGKK